MQGEAITKAAEGKAAALLKEAAQAQREGDNVKLAREKSRLCLVKIV